MLQRWRNPSVFLHHRIEGHLQLLKWPWDCPALLVTAQPLPLPEGQERELLLPWKKLRSWHETQLCDKCLATHAMHTSMGSTALIAVSLSFPFFYDDFHDLQALNDPIRKTEDKDSRVCCLLCHTLPVWLPQTNTT